MAATKEEREKQKQERLELEKLNNQGSLMKIVEYEKATRIKVKFLDTYGYETYTYWHCFESGEITNPFFPVIYGIGIVGNKYPASIKGKHTKEFQAWNNIFVRCCNEKRKEEFPTYKDCTVCEEWLYFPNFYEWLHNQENFERWLNGKRWCVDKDILIKNNKIYSPDTCCLVPNNINVLFTKSDATRGRFPIGVTKLKEDNCYISRCGQGSYASYNTPKEAFKHYKKEKEQVIKKIAREEFDKGNITKQCYEAMMSYEVEITD